MIKRDGGRLMGLLLLGLFDFYMIVARSTMAQRHGKEEGGTLAKF
jgi:hypothetical protein